MEGHNAVREALEADEAIVGAKATTLSPAVVEVYGELGLDFAWLDFETAGRSPWDAEALANLARAGETAGVEPVVRLPSGDPMLVGRALDAGIRTLLIPRVETAGEARRAVRAARFEFDGGPGDRGAAVGRANAWGDRDARYLRDEDASTLVGVTLESEAANENADAILSVPDLGFAVVGRGDMSVSLGRPMETDHPEVRDAIATIRDACLDHGVPPGRYVSAAPAAADAVAAGYRLLLIGGDIASTREVIGERADAVRDVL